MIPRLKKSGAKYGNKKVEIDGIMFDSTKEGKCYLYLKDLLAKGVISDLKLHPKWELIPKITETYIKHLKTKDKECERTVQLPITYSADFSCVFKEKTFVFDIKASKFMLPKEYCLKVKLMRYFHNIEVINIYKPSDFDKYINNND
jgi:hypothetical protein